MSPTDRSSANLDPAARPQPLAQRLKLLLILLVIPMAAVTLPALVVTQIFGQRPKPKAPPIHATPKPTPARAKPSPTPDTSGLAAALNHSAESLLPTPAPLSLDPIHLTVRADHVVARAEKVSGQAKALGGSAVEGVASGGEKHLFVDLPPGRADAFREAVTKNMVPVVPSATPTTGAAHDQVEVIIRSAADDE